MGFVVSCLAVLLAVAPAPSAQSLDVPPSITVPSGFQILAVAQVPSARELVALPNGDLIVGTESRAVYLVPNAEAGSVGAPHVFATLPEGPAAGVAFAAAPGVIYFATEHGVYAADYHPGQGTAAVAPIARVRTGAIAPHSDGDVHSTTSVAYAEGTVYASVGSSCNACTEVDPTRAVILSIPPRGGSPVSRAVRIRNAIALAVNPDTHALWAGDAGQDNLPFGHPYEFLDDVTSHAGVADYGWPECEEDHHAYTPGATCANTVAPLVELPAYSTIIGATFYSTHQTGSYVFPAAVSGRTVCGDAWVVASGGQRGLRGRAASHCGRDGGRPSAGRRGLAKPQCAVADVCRRIPTGRARPRRTSDGNRRRAAGESVRGRRHARGDLSHPPEVAMRVCAEDRGGAGVGEAHRSGGHTGKRMLRRADREIPAVAPARGRRRVREKTQATPKRRCLRSVLELV